MWHTYDHKFDPCWWLERKNSDAPICILMHRTKILGVNRCLYYPRRFLNCQVEFSSLSFSLYLHEQDQREALIIHQLYAFIEVFLCFHCHICMWMYFPEVQLTWVLLAKSQESYTTVQKDNSYKYIFYVHIRKKYCMTTESVVYKISHTN